jgi:hypothetical protein
MAHPLDGYAWKRLRARQHFDTLHEEINGFLKSHPFRLSTEFDPSVKEYLVRAHVMKQPPTLLSILVGDCLYNLRSALETISRSGEVVKASEPE